MTFENGASLFNSVKIQTSIVYDASWQNYNFTAKREGIPAINATNKATGNIVVKADSIPYYHADYYTAKEMSRRLYSNHKYVKSGLVTGTMWDVMLKYMSDNGLDITATNWGNCGTVALTNLSGYYTNITEKEEAGKIAGETDGFKSSKTLNTTGKTVLLTTGSTETVKRMNLYDVLGNLWEWTEETAYSQGFKYDGSGTCNLYMFRGAGAETQTAGNLSLKHVYYRAGRTVPNTWTLYGFRPVLFLQ